MTKTKHTPAPWEIRVTDKYNIRMIYAVGADDDDFVCDDVRTEADGNLIAAAPEMYDACEHALEHVTDALLYPDDDPLVVELRAALAKARGDDR